MSDKLSEDELIKVLKIWYKGEHTQAYKQIWEIIKKPQVTEEWIDNFVEEKAKEFIVRANIAIQNPEAYRQQLDITEDFIRSLVKEIVGK